jgi:hypothetical protein
MGGIATIDGLSRNFGMSGVTSRQDGIHTYRSIGVSATSRAASFGKERREISGNSWRESWRGLVGTLHLKP